MDQTFLLENMGETFYDIGFGDNFLDMPPKGKAMEASVDT